jgi:hypothetical protein
MGQASDDRNAHCQRLSAIGALRTLPSIEAGATKPNAELTSDAPAARNMEVDER